MDIKPQKFEGDEDSFANQDNLLRYIEDHIPLAENYGNQIRLSDKASMRWLSSYRSGGSRHRAWNIFNARIEAELLHCEIELEPVVQESAQAQV